MKTLICWFKGHDWQYFRGMKGTRICLRCGKQQVNAYHYDHNIIGDWGDRKRISKILK